MKVALVPGVPSSHSHASGFTLVEIAVVLLILGFTLGFTIPTFRSFRQSQELDAASQNLVGQLRVGRQKAIGTLHEQRMTFSVGTNSYTVQDLTTGERFGPFHFPKDIALEQARIVVGGVTGATIVALGDGRYSGSGEIILRDSRGRRDTVSVQSSGLALNR